MDLERLLKLAAIERGRRALEAEPLQLTARQTVTLEKAAQASDRELLACAVAIAPPGRSLEVYEQLGGQYKVATTHEAHSVFYPLFGAAGGAVLGESIGKHLGRAAALLSNKPSAAPPLGVALGGLGLLVGAVSGVHAGMKADAYLFDKGRKKTSADLTAASRDQIKPKNFAVPAKISDTGTPKYPIHDKNHAENALARVAQHGSDVERQRVYDAIAKKFPELAARSSVPAVKAKVEKQGAWGEGEQEDPVKMMGSNWQT